MNVTSTIGGKVHLEDDESPVPFPLCGSARRNTRTRFRKTDAAIDCKECCGILERRAAREAKEREAVMAKNDVQSVDGAMALEQIKANVERARSLATAGDAEALDELRSETETLISSLTGKGSIAIKKEQRDAMAEAAATKPSAEVANQDEADSDASWERHAGVKELAVMGAEKIANGVRLHMKAGELARDVAAVIFDMWKRIPNKDGLPDLRGDSDDAKKAWQWTLREAGIGFEQTYETEKALERLQRNVQRQRSDIRAQYLRGLAADSDEAAEERALYASQLGDADNDSVPTRLAAYYRVSLKGEIEADKEKYQARLAGGEAKPAELPAANPDEILAQSVKRISSDLRKLKPEELVGASDAVKAEARRKLDELREQMKDLVTALM